MPLTVLAGRPDAQVAYSTTQFFDESGAPYRHHVLRPFPRWWKAVLLPRCAALIHHGGIGTAAQALRAAIPQVIAPLAYDQRGAAYQ